MTTLEDKILGEKSQYYCSSSEDEADDDSNGSDKLNKACASKVSYEDESKNFSEWGGTSSNTGPKGVIKVCFYSIFIFIAI